MHATKQHFRSAFGGPFVLDVDKSVLAVQSGSFEWRQSVPTSARADVSVGVAAAAAAAVVVAVNKAYVIEMIGERRVSCVVHLNTK